jgi:hypothetical protein
MAAPQHLKSQIANDKLAASRHLRSQIQMTNRPLRGISNFKSQISNLLRRMPNQIAD